MVGLRSVLPPAQQCQHQATTSQYTALTLRKRLVVVWPTLHGVLLKREAPSFNVRLHVYHDHFSGDVTDNECLCVHLIASVAEDRCLAVPSQPTGDRSEITWKIPGLRQSGTYYLFVWLQTGCERSDRRAIPA